ncbi:hypothetical protein BDZ89DRAFT_1060488 [Hymenopellis radicata]|nr:hypothetical protein BDZ89DRAFT_1060488 [Hymenopellis radicata]
MISENESPVAPKKRRLRGACDLCKLKKSDSAKMPNNICSNCIAYNEQCTHDMLAVKKVSKQSSGYPDLPIISFFVNYSLPSGSIPSDSGHSPEASVYAGEEALNAQISQILSSPPLLPTDPVVVQQLLIDLARRVRDLDAELAVCRQVLAREASGEVSISHGVIPASTAPTVDENISSVVEDKSDLVLTDSLKRLTVGQSRHRHYGKSSAIMIMKHALDIKRDLIGGEGLSFSVKRGEFWNNQPMTIFPRTTFPDDDLMHELLNLYFEEDNETRLFERKVAQGLHEYDRAFGAVVREYTNDPRVFLNPANGHTSGWKYFEQIRPLPTSFTSPATLYDLQVYALSVLYANGTTTYTGIELGAPWVRYPDGNRPVGAHRRKPDSGRPTIEDEEWKRAFCAVTTGRPLATTADDYDVELPVLCDDEYWDNPDPQLRFIQPPGVQPKSTILAFSHRTIRSKLSSELAGPDWDKKVIVAIDSSLNRWVDDLPSFLRWNPHHPNTLFFRQSMTLYALYYFIQIQVHRPFIWNTGRSPSEVPSVSYPSLAICVNAARALCHIVDIYQKRGMRPAFVVQIMIFYSAIVLVINIWRNKRSGTQKQVEKDLENVQHCLNILKMHESRWQIAGRYADMIRALLADLDTLPLGRSTQSSPSSLKRTRDEATFSAPPDSLLALPNMDWTSFSSPSMSSSSTSEIFETIPRDTIFADIDVFDLPVYTDELGRPSPSSTIAAMTELAAGTGTDASAAYDYAAWFQANFPMDTLLTPGIHASNEPHWTESDHPGRLDGGFLTSFMGQTHTQYEIQPTPNFNAIDPEMAMWFNRPPEA